MVSRSNNYFYPMKTGNTAYLSRFILGCLLLFSSAASFGQAPQNWTKEQLMEPAQLAERINAGDTSLLIISVGPGALIPHSVNVKPVQEKDNLLQFKKQLEAIDKDKELVIYCGCCPFEHCPNVRPAIALLQELHFTRYKLLDLPHNIKANWLDKGYPRVKL